MADEEDADGSTLRRFENSCIRKVPEREVPARFQRRRPRTARLPKIARKLRRLRWLTKRTARSADGGARGRTDHVGLAVARRTPLSFDQVGSWFPIHG